MCFGNDKISRYILFTNSNVTHNCAYSIKIYYEWYCQLSLSWTPRDSLKYFEISVSRHIRFAELRRKKNPNNHIGYVCRTEQKRTLLCNKSINLRLHTSSIWGKIISSSIQKLTVTTRTVNCKYNDIHIVYVYIWKRTREKADRTKGPTARPHRVIICRTQSLELEFVFRLLNLEIYWKYCGKEEKLLLGAISSLLHNILLPVVRFSC